MPRRPGRLRRRPGRLRRAGPRARRDLPGRQPRPRGARHDSARAVLARGRAGGDVDAGDDQRPRPRAFLDGLEPQNVEEAVGALPRQPARPGLGVRAVPAAGRAVLRRPAAPRLPDRPLPRRAVVLARPGRARDRRDPRRRARSSTWRGRVAAQPRQRRPAPRRRPAGGVAASSTSTGWRAIYRRTEYDIAGAAARDPRRAAARLAGRAPALRAVSSQLAASYGTPDAACSG